MNNFRALVEEASGLANAPAAIENIADELDDLIASENFTHYQHQRLTAMVWALRLMGESSTE